jgi:PEP-CTERM motif
MPSKLAIILAAAGLLAAHLTPTAKGQAVYFQITDLGGGNTHWQILASDTTYTVGPFNQTGILEEQINLPVNAFALDYSQNFTLSFSSSLGVIENVMTGQSVALNQISYSYYPQTGQPGQLQITGGGLNERLGDTLAITAFSGADIAIPFSALTAIGGPEAYGGAGVGWHNDTVVDIIPIQIPEPSSLALFALSITGLLRRVYSRGLAR